MELKHVVFDRLIEEFRIDAEEKINIDQLEEGKWIPLWVLLVENKDLFDLANLHKYNSNYYKIEQVSKDNVELLDRIMDFYQKNIIYAYPDFAAILKADTNAVVLEESAQGIDPLQRKIIDFNALKREQSNQRRKEQEEEIDKEEEKYVEIAIGNFITHTLGQYEKSDPQSIFKSFNEEERTIQLSSEHMPKRITIPIDDIEEYKVSNR